MKVLFLTPNFPTPEDAVRGNMVLSLTSAIRENNVDLRVVHIDERLIWPFNRMARYSYHRARPASVSTLGEKWATRFFTWNLPRSLGVTARVRWHRRSVMRHIRKTWGDFQPDIVHARTFIPAGLTAETIAKGFGCPFVISSHGYDTRVYVCRTFPRYDIRRLSRKADAVVSASEMIEQVLSEHGCLFRRHSVIYNGVDLQRIHAGDNPLREKYSGRKIIVGLGNLKASKGFDILIRATAGLVKNHRDILTIIVGGGDQQTALQQLIDSLQLSEHVELVGPQAPDMAMKYLDLADVFCLPSWSEGFGIAYLEAMASGKPVIAVEGQGIEPLVRRYNVGLLTKPKDVESVINALEQLLGSESLRADMGGRAMDLARNKLTWDHCAKQYIELYQDILASSGR